MRRWTKRLVSAFLIVLVGFVLTPMLTRNQTTTAAAVLDYVNPVVQENTVYVSPATDSVQWRANNHGGLDYRYQVKSYDRYGIERDLILTVSDAPLETTGYLAVSTKGQTVLSWRQVSRKQVPSAALHHLQQQ